ncbi:MAG: MFS transporter [Proteobacteria bacterium]|nr:MFS transporter [Pseudomonadota bacterium]MDA1302403.1 MFS transporter [Pseudomonadota bacterium]
MTEELLHARLTANIWKLQVIQASRWFLLIMPVLVLFYQENGLTLTEVFLVQAVFSISVILLEVPSGYFADRLGRRRSILFGMTFAAFGFISYSFADSMAEFMLAEVIIAIGAAFVSGSDSALLYDTLLQTGRQNDYQREAGRLASVGNFSEGIAGLLGGVLALISLRTPLYFHAMLLLITLPLIFTLVEPARNTPAGHINPFRAIAQIVRYALHGHTEVKWLILYSSLVSTSTLTIVWLVQPFLLHHGLPLALFGVAWAVLQFSVGLAAMNAHRVESFLGRRNALTLLILLAAVAYLLLGWFDHYWAAGVLFVFYFVRGINGPVLNDYVNRCIEPDIRATVLSVKSLVGRMMFVVLGPIVGWVNDAYSLQVAFVFCGSVFLILGIYFLSRLHRNAII